MHRSGGAKGCLGATPQGSARAGEPLMCPAYEPGDLALIYVAGTYRCPAVVELVAPPLFDATAARWGWRTEVRLVAQVAELEDAPTLEEIGVPRVSVGRQSRLRLRPEQFAAGLRRGFPGSACSH